MRQIEYSLQAADYQEFYVVVCLRRIWRFSLLVSLLASGVFAAEQYCLCGGLTARGVMDAALSGTTVACLVSVAILALNALGGRQIHANVSNLSREYRLEWNDDGVLTHSKYVEGSFPWSLFSKWTETKSLIAIYLNEMQPLIFPKRAFEIEELIDLKGRLQSSGVKKA